MNKSLRSAPENREDHYARLIARHSSESIVVTDRDGRVEWCNAAFTQLSGYALDELVGKKPGTLLQGDLTDPATIARIGQAVSERREIQAEIVNYTKSGVPYWIEMRVTPIFDVQGNHTHFMAIERDISSRKSLEEKSKTMLAREKRMRMERQLLAASSEWLYSSRTSDEVLMVVERALQAMFPESAGALYVYANSRDALDLMVTWSPSADGIGNPPDHFEPAECWSLRRGRAYHYGSAPIEFPCGHVHAAPERYFCLPLIAQGETIGMLHIQPDANMTDTDTDQTFQLALLCGEQVSLALANVQLRQELLDQSIRDPLTSLPNRRWFLDAALRDFARAAKTGTPVSLISLDVDHFKRFNDNHGHDAGDMVLRAVGKAMIDHFPDDIYPCRVGGEEFVVLCAKRDRDAAAALAESFRETVQTLSVFHAGGQLPPITVSAGVACFPQDGSDLVAVNKAADAALYRAKAAGRDTVVQAGATRTV